MSESESRIRSLADEFARTVVGTLRSMTIDELAGLVQVGPPRFSGAATNRPAKRAAPPKKVPGTKAGTVIKRKDGRTFTNTAKAIAAHKLQGQYIGHLGQVPAKEKEHFRKIAHEKGVAAAVAALKKRVGKEPTAAPKAAKKAAATPAKRKAKAMPASYYRCAHPGCTKNWFVNGRPYCGEHANLHGKRKA